MSLYIDIRVNRDVVAQAAVQNISAAEGDVCDYRGRAHTNPFADRGFLTHSIEVDDHDRSKSVWLLVAKIALRLAAEEGAPL